jgi:hypothetical protein
MGDQPGAAVELAAGLLNGSFFLGGDLLVLRRRVLEPPVQRLLASVEQPKRLSGLGFREVGARARAAALSQSRPTR